MKEFRIPYCSFENKVLRKIFGCKVGKVTGNWRKLHNEKLHNLYSLPNRPNVRASKLRRIICSKLVARMMKRKIKQNFGWEN
jgi:hypothetical protein